MTSMRGKRISIILCAVAVMCFLGIFFAGCQVSPSKTETVEIKDNNGNLKDELRVGIISDTQLPSTPSEDGYHYEQNLYRALMYYKNAGIDALMFAGDFTDLASVYAYNCYNRVYNKVFETWKQDSKTPVNLYIMGNHDYWAPAGEALAPYSAQRRFKKMLGESPASHKVLNGYHFISWSGADGGYWESHKNTKWLEEQIEEAVADDPGKPIFVQTHYAPKDTMYGSDDWYTNHIKEVFDRYPNVVHFSGHSHYALADERSIWQGENGFTAIQTQSLSYVELEAGKEDGRDWTDGYKKGWEGTIPENCEENPSGLIMTVVNNLVEVERVSFAEGVDNYGEVYGDSDGNDYKWTINFNETDLAKRNLYTVAKRLEAAKAAGAPIKNIDDYGEVIKDANGSIFIRFSAFGFKDATSKSFVHSYSLRFFRSVPTSADGAIAFDVQTGMSDGKAVTASKSQFVYFSDFLVGRDRMSDTVTLRFNPQVVSQLTPGTYWVLVTATDSFGQETVTDAGTALLKKEFKID